MVVLYFCLSRRLVACTRPEEHVILADHAERGPEEAPTARGEGYGERGRKREAGGWSRTPTALATLSPHRLPVWAVAIGISAMLVRILTGPADGSGRVKHLPSSTATGFFLLPSPHKRTMRRASTWGVPTRDGSSLAANRPVVAAFSQWPSHSLSMRAASAAPSPPVKPFSTFHWSLSPLPADDRRQAPPQPSPDRSRLMAPTEPVFSYSFRS